MRFRSRSVLAIAVLVTVGGAAAAVATGQASADTAPTRLPAGAAHRIAAFQSINEMVVDGVHRHVLVSDPSAGRILAFAYNGTVADTVTDVPDVNGLLLSADSKILYAGIDGGIVAYDTATLTESARFTISTRVSRLAISAGKLWYSARAVGRSEGELGSVNLTDGTVARFRQADLGLEFSGAPLLATSPAHPGVLAVSSGQGNTEAIIRLLDVTGATPSVVANRDLTQHLINPRVMKFSGDGSQVVLGGADGLRYSSATDLSDKGGIRVNRADIFDITGGWLALAAHKTFATSAPDLSLIPSGASTATRGFTYPFTDNLPQTAAVAWEPGGRRLFAITTTVLDQTNLWEIEEPTKP